MNLTLLLSFTHETERMIEANTGMDLIYVPMLLAIKVEHSHCAFPKAMLQWLGHLVDEEGLLHWMKQVHNHP